MEKKEKILKDIHCSKCGPKGNLIHFGKRTMRNGGHEQLIRCTECRKLFLMEKEYFKGLHDDKEIIFQILKSLVAEKKTVRSVAGQLGKSPGAVQRTGNRLKILIKEKLDEVADKTGLTRGEVADFIRKKKNWDKD